MASGRLRMRKTPVRLTLPIPRTPAPTIPTSHQSPGDNTLLNVFLGFVATFFHESSGQVSPKAPAPRSRHHRASQSRHLFSGHGFFRPAVATSTTLCQSAPRRCFHNYFVTHLPSSSLHPDSRSSSGPHHKLPRSASTPYTPKPGSSPAASPPNMPTRDLTVVRIPLRSAKHHYGAYVSRGQRPYNEDTHQAGCIDIPAFARRGPISLVRSAQQKSKESGEGTSADGALGDPQIFYFAVFDGHGGTECSDFLREELHGYIEHAAEDLMLKSSLRPKMRGCKGLGSLEESSASDSAGAGAGPGHAVSGRPQPKGKSEVQEQIKLSEENDGNDSGEQSKGTTTVPADRDASNAARLERDLVREYKSTIGGYFRRFRPAHFELTRDVKAPKGGDGPQPAPATIELVLTYAFLRADLDFVTAQAHKPDPDDPYAGDFPLNNDEILGVPHLTPSGHGIGGPVRFRGGSTASVALISTPTPAPFWHPAANSSLLVAHVGDTRVLLCETATGQARPLTSDHHPSSPAEQQRLRRYAESMVTDSFGEERISGLANSRSFGDVGSKRIGVSAEPEVTRVELGPAEYAFIVLVSDGVSGSVGDQEIVDVVKEAATPEQGARAVVDYATEVSRDGDNATCLVVRLGGWERRSEGGLGSLGTKEIRDIRRAEAQDPRTNRR